jgi:hypothetical protein
MSLMTDSVMLIYCDFDGDGAEHDEWHSHEHLHERLSIPGFVRGTRWARSAGSPKYLIVYEVTSLDVAVSPPYLARLNDPSPWTASIMPRVTGMTRGFCKVNAGAGYGLGGIALSVRCGDGSAAAALPALAARRGIASAHLFEPGPRPPMTKEQSLRGRDTDMGWVLFATGYDRAALERAGSEHAGPGAEAAIFTLQHTVAAGDAARGRPQARA